MQSDTPRTDEELKRITSMCDGDSDDTCYVMDQLGKHARELERELAAAKDELSKKIGELAAMQKQRDEAVELYTDLLRRLSVSTLPRHAFLSSDASEKEGGGA